MQRFVSWGPASWLFSRTLHHVDRVVSRITGGRETIPSMFMGLPTLTFTTVGAKSGIARTLPLIYIQDQEEPTRIALVASNFGSRHNPAWYYNLKAAGKTTCTIAGRTGPYVVHEATGAEYDRFWQSAADTYIGYPLYKERAGGRHIPIMVLTPAPN